MALTRKFLSAMGIEPEKIDQIIEAHTEVTDALKAERDRFRADAEKLPGVQGELDTLKQASGADGDWKTRYEQVKKEFDQYKADETAKAAAARKADAYKAILRDIGLTDERITAIMKITDLSGETVNEAGQLENAEQLKAAAQTEWAAFIPTTGKQSAPTPTPPAEQHPDYDSMSDADYYKAVYETARKGK